MSKAANPAVPVIKLTGDNWAVWKFQTTIILKGRGLFDLVDGSRAKPSTPGNELIKWEKDDAKAQEILVTRMDQDPLTHVLSSETAKDMWAKLKSVYDKESAVSIHLLQQRFFLLEFDSTVSMFISKIEEVRKKLKSAGEMLSDKMVMTKILMALPEQYHHFRSAWESVPAEGQTLEELTSRLLLEEERAKAQESTQALVTNTKKRNVKRCYICSKVGHLAKSCYFRNKNGKGQNNDKSSDKIKKFCSHCKKLGHEIHSCWFKKGNKEENSTKKNDKEEETNAFMVNTENSKRNDWYLDSGASEHMCWNRNCFQTIKKLQNTKMVQVGSGEKLEVKGVGNIKLWAYNGEKQIETTLTQVLYVPDLKFNLFSTGCALDKGYYMMSDNKKCEFINKAGETRALAIRSNKLYKMLFTLEKSTEYNLTTLSIPECENKDSSSYPEEYEVQDFMSECMKVNSIENIKDWHCKSRHGDTCAAPLHSTF